MPGLNPKKINSFLAVIRDTRTPIEERNSALHALEREVNKNLSTEQGRFEASLATFDQQWNQLEKTQFAFENSLDSILSSDVDEDEVDKLMQQVQDEVRLEKAHNPVSPGKKKPPTLGELEKRLQALRVFNQRLMPNSKQEKTEVSGRELDEENELAKLEQELDEEEQIFNPAALVDSIDEIITNTEVVIDDLEDELQALKAPEENIAQSYSSGLFNDSLSEAYDTTSLQKKIKPSPTTTYTETSVNESPVPSVQKPDKPGLWNALAKNFMSIIQGVGNFLRNIGNKNISLSDATTRLKDAQIDLDKSGRRLERANGRLKTALGEIQNKNAGLLNAVMKHRQAGKAVLKKQNVLTKLRADTHMSRENKNKAIKTLKSQISSVKQEHSKLGRHVRQLTHQLGRVKEKASTAHDELKDAKQAHKVITKSVDKAINHMEKALKQQHKDQDRLIGTQQKAKSLLQESRLKHQKAQEQDQSADRTLETPKP